MLQELEWGSNIGLVFLAILVVGMLIRGSGYGGSPTLTIVMALILLDVFYLGTVVLRINRKKREVSSGYTTVTNEFPHVDQIDPKTGRIVRLAGEETLNRDEYLRRTDLIREVIDTNRPGSAGGSAEG
ncbi:hypothetical protein [Promicromonospora iranensis]|uniref:PH (Pleckstrin Homology) domain-containing protein n=1 Tax=Promicromonospora iranensis TaxID=1105144 RepID=A0ABU2CLN1_9MICO|nr:hypothetical protein [Promicromonospora iranensis]MDR7382218.1 hypothetical protein [Promicromonospora iranensis]